MGPLMVARSRLVIDFVEHRPRIGRFFNRISGGWNDARSLAHCLAPSQPPSTPTLLNSAGVTFRYGPTKFIVGEPRSAP